MPKVISASEVRRALDATSNHNEEWDCRTLGDGESNAVDFFYLSGAKRPVTHADCYFVSYSREYVVALLDEIDRLNKVIKNARDELREA